MLLARLYEHVDGRNREDEMDDHGGGDSSQLSTPFDGCKAIYNFRSSYNVGSGLGCDLRLLHAHRVIGGHVRAALVQLHHWVILTCEPEPMRLYFQRSPPHTLYSQNS